MREFLEASAELNKDISRLQVYAKESQRYILQKQNSVLTEDEEGELDRKIEGVDELFSKLSSKVKSRIQKNQSETLHCKQRGVARGVIEMRELHTFRHSRDLSEVLRNYQSIQCDYQQREKLKLKETFLIANPNATEEDLERLTDGVHGDALLASAFALGSHSAQAVLVHAKNRSKKIEKIVDMINKLVQLIEDIDKIVKKNTHVVDQITINMSSAEAHTNQANRELTSALAYEIRAMRIKRFLVGIVVIMVIAFIVYLFRDRIFRN